ncbi:MAG: serine/threonine-protein kinase [Pseudomonadota bacterium]
MSFQAETKVGNYVIKNLIAEGGMGAVWRAWDPARNGYVAIKAISNDLLDDRDFENRFLDEVMRHARLNHPNIVPVLDVFESGGQCCCVMELIEGTSLSALLDHSPERRLDVEAAIPIIEDILKALDYAHRQGIIHRDVKPSNILLDEHNRARLIDFGIALAVGEKRRTRTGLVVGTPLYMSPEQITKPKSIDHRTDVYSVGCIFYEMLTGRPPFLPGPEGRGDTDFAIKQAHVKEMPVPPSELRPDIPPDLDRLILWALEKDPNQRIPGCQEFSRLLSEPGTRIGKQSHFDGVISFFRSAACFIKRKIYSIVALFFIVAFIYFLLQIEW